MSGRRSIHIAQAIRDDLSDAYLRKNVCPGLKTKDGHTPRDLFESAKLTTGEFNEP